MAAVAAVATVVAVIAVVLLLAQAIATPMAAASAADGVVSDNAVVAGITNATPSSVDGAVAVAVNVAATPEVVVTTVFVGAVADAAAGTQSAVGKDAPVASNVRPDLMGGVLAVTTAVVAVTAVLSVLCDVTAESFPVQFHLLCLPVKVFIVFL